MSDKIRRIEFKPEEPVEHGGKQYPVLVFRRMKGKDMVAMDRVEGELMKSFAMYASMAGVPIPVIEELDVDDFARMAEETMPLLGKSSGKVKQMLAKSGQVEAGGETGNQAAPEAGESNSFELMALAMARHLHQDVGRVLNWTGEEFLRRFDLMGDLLEMEAPEPE